MTIHVDFTSQEYFRDPAAKIEKLRAAVGTERLPYGARSGNGEARF
jgi:hypothetical protein